MGKVIVRRIITLIPVLIGISIVIFLSLYFAPGDAATIMGGPTATAEDIVAIRQNLGLDDPLLVQYLRFFKGILKGNLGYSYQTKQLVSDAIATRLPNTLKLASFSIIIAVLIGVPIGVLSAIKRNTATDYAATVFALFGVSIPSFWLGIMLIILFSVTLGWLPAGGSGDGLMFIESLKYFILPAVTLGLSSSAIITRMTRSSVLEILQMDFVRTAWAKGAPERKIILVHTLRNALVPVVTIIGVNFAALLGGTIITEQVFSINGVGRLLIQAIGNRDFPVVQGCVLLIATTFVVINLIVDILYTIIDPRISY